MKNRKLAVFLGVPVREREQAPQPTPREALYGGPNPDSTPKRCGNCCLWLGNRQRCFIHDGDVVATARMVCAFHVFGEPDRTDSLSVTNAGSVRPEQSGLTLPPGDSVCRTCQWFEPASIETGVCHALADPESDASALVRPLGRCARWT